MDFTSNSWGTDEISTSMSSQHPIMSGEFVNQSAINDVIAWPERGAKFPSPPKKLSKNQYDRNMHYNPINQLIPKKQTRRDIYARQNPAQTSTQREISETFTNFTPELSENMLIIFMLAVLIFMCVMIYSTVKQTHETMTLLAGMMLSKST
jgi:hypothetical protein